MEEETTHPDGLCDNFLCQQCCDHQEHDHGICLDCGADILDRLIRDADDYFDRRDDDAVTES